MVVHLLLSVVDLHLRSSLTKLAIRNHKILWLQWMWIVRPIHVSIRLTLTLVLRQVVRVLYLNRWDFLVMMSVACILQILMLIVVNAHRLVPPLLPIPLVVLLLTFSTLPALLSVLPNRVLALSTGPQECTPHYHMNPIVLWTVRCMIGVLPILASGNRNA